MNRRKDDVSASRLALALAYLACALGLLSSYVGYRACTLANAVDAANEASFQFGQMVGRSHRMKDPNMPGSGRESY